MRRRVVVALASAAWLASIGPAAAITNEHDHAWDDRPTGDYTFYCTIDGKWASGCFAPRGEWFSVEDGDKDGWSAVVVWQSRHQVTGELLRKGEIWHLAGYGSGNKKYENKSFDEGRTIVWKACAGYHPDHEVHNDKCSSWVSKSA